MTMRMAVLAATVSAVAAAGRARLLQGPTAPAGATMRLSGTAMLAIPPTPHPTPRGGPVTPADPTPAPAPPGAASTAPPPPPDASP